TGAELTLCLDPVATRDGPGAMRLPLRAIEDFAKESECGRQIDAGHIPVRSMPAVRSGKATADRCAGCPVQPETQGKGEQPQLLEKSRTSEIDTIAVSSSYLNFNAVTRIQSCRPCNSA